MKSLIGKPSRPEIDQYAIKFIIGAVAFSLPWIEIWLTKGLTSISQSFWSDNRPWPRTLFVGLLFVIAALLLAYNGHTSTQMWLAKAASLAAFGIAMFPCQCGADSNEIIKGVHGGLAGVMFAVLAAFCYIFRERALQKEHRQAKWRAHIYEGCFAGMLIAIGLFIANWATGLDVLVLYGETVGLMSFAVSWLTASRVFPGITHPTERQPLIKISPGSLLSSRATETAEKGRPAG